MSSLPPTRPRRGVATLARAALLLAVACVLCGGSCTVWYSSGHDDPGPCWDDDPDNDDLCPDNQPAAADQPAPPDVAPEDLSLLGWTLEPNVEPGRHPVGRMHSAVGLSLPDLWGPGAWGEDAAFRFAHDVIRANPALLALPREAGTLRAGAVLALEQRLVVEYEQAPPGIDTTGAAVPGASLWFVFDARLRLVEIRNRTLVPAGVLLPPPLEVRVSGARPAAGSARTPPR